MFGQKATKPKKRKRRVKNRQKSGIEGTITSDKISGDVTQGSEGNYLH